MNACCILHVGALGVWRLKCCVDVTVGGPVVVGTEGQVMLQWGMWWAWPAYITLQCLGRGWDIRHENVGGFGAVLIDRAYNTLFSFQVHSNGTDWNDPHNSHRHGFL